MADILIKNMEMPQEWKMFVIEADGSVWVQIKDTSYFCTGSKAVALPEHHGRLGDLDALKNSVADMRMEKPLRNGAKQVIEIGKLFGRIIEDAPTIVEATE